jgi:subfamily B ATP-binding cassette protein MsbA
MRQFLRLMRYVRPYWRRLLAALVCMTVFAALSGLSLGMILPFANVLFEEQTLVGAGGAETAIVAPVDSAGEPAGSAGEPAGSAGELLGTVVNDIEGGDIGLGGAKQELRARLLAVFASDTPQSALLKISLGLIVVFFVRALFRYLQILLMITLEQRIIRDLRNALFSHLTRLSLSFFQRERTGQLISRVTNDVMLVRGALVATFADMFRESLLAVMYLGVAVWISWHLSIITILVLPPMMLLIGRIGIRLRRRNVRIQEKMADITSTLEESISGIRVVQAFGMEEYEKGRFFFHTAGYLRRFVRMESLGALAGPLTEFLGVVGVVAILWYGGRQVLLAKTISSDWFLIFLAASLSTMQPLRNISRANTRLQTGLAAAGRVFDTLDAEPAVKSAPDAEPIHGFDEAIRYEDVAFSYETGLDVLHGVDLSIRRGEVVAIVGPSGAGKSTLLDLLPRFYDPTAGRITVDGRDIKEVELSSLRGLMGIVTQETILFNDTLGANIAYGVEGAGHEDIAAAAEAANAREFIEAMPDAYDTVIGERGTRLSGGERQRVAIARAILKDPPILIFDEATSSLDTESERLVQGAIERLLKGRTVLIIAHRLSTVRNAHRIIVVDGGSIVESGTHTELMQQDGLYRRLYEMQFGDEDGDGRGDDRIRKQQSAS